MGREAAWNCSWTLVHRNSPWARFANGGPTSSCRKAHARRLRYEEVYTADHRPSRKAHARREADEEGVLYPHNDALVVTMLINNGSSAYIRFWDVFTEMGIDPAILWLALMPLKELSWDMVSPRWEQSPRRF